MKPTAISTVVGFISTLECFEVNMKDEFPFSAINYNIPKLKELSICQNSINNFKNISN